MNILICGDSLTACREHLAPASVHLAYIDPPQSLAADDLLPLLHECRCLLHPTGSLYLFATPEASHRLRIALDQALGPEQYRAQIAWRHAPEPGHDPANGLRPSHGIIIFYARGPEWAWQPQYIAHDEAQRRRRFRYIEPGTGRPYALVDLTTSKPGGDTLYEWRGARPFPGRFWAYSRANLDALARAGRIHFAPPGMPRLKQYLDEHPGLPLTDVWTDIPRASAQERLHRPDARPQALLERLIRSTTLPGQLVLDPFCREGAVLSVAQGLGRFWVGIDRSHVSIAQAQSHPPR